MELMRSEIALYGFVSPVQTVEPAGIFYETRVIRDKLALGHSTEPVLRQLKKVDLDLSSLPAVEENDDCIAVRLLQHWIV